MFERLEKIIGKSNIEKLNNTSVMVIGIGGVGGYAVEALVRCGIKHLIIVDHDIVDITNKNRQIIALDSTIGMKKVEVMRKRILDINSECKVDTLDTFLDNKNTYEMIKEYHPDYVVDACDTITVKLELIRICKQKNIKLISSMGTGNKMDPSKLKIMDVRKTNYDKIAKIIRKMVKDEKIKGKVMVVSSDEIGYTKVKDVIPSNSFVPACSGLLCASYIINDIIGDNYV